MMNERLRCMDCLHAEWMHHYLVDDLDRQVCRAILDTQDGACVCMCEQYKKPEPPYAWTLCACGHTYEQHFDSDYYCKRFGCHCNAFQMPPCQHETISIYDYRHVCDTCNTVVKVDKHVQDIVKGKKPVRVGGSLKKSLFGGKDD